MDITIKEHIINNFKNDKEEDIKEAIDESTESDDEVTLPGLGVFMTLIWESSSDKEKQELVSKIRNALDKVK